MNRRGVVKPVRGKVRGTASAHNAAHKLSGYTAGAHRWGAPENPSMNSTVKTVLVILTTIAVAKLVKPSLPAAIQPYLP